jgi:hypothetical protein
MPKPGMVGVTGSPSWNLSGFRSQAPWIVNPPPGSAEPPWWRWFGPEITGWPSIFRSFVVCSY